MIAFTTYNVGEKIVAGCLGNIEEQVHLVLHNLITYWEDLLKGKFQCSTCPDI